MGDRADEGGDATAADAKPQRPTVLTPSSTRSRLRVQSLQSAARLRDEEARAPATGHALALGPNARPCPPQAEREEDLAERRQRDSERGAAALKASMARARAGASPRVRGCRGARGELHPLELPTTRGAPHAARRAVRATSWLKPSATAGSHVACAPHPGWLGR
jgi:hypothetical protein